MAETTKSPTNGNVRDKLSWLVFGFSTLAIIILALTVVLVDRTEAHTVFYTLLPVLASWVGTLLAFYYGRENFESANQQIQRIVQRLTPDQRGTEPVSEHMMPLETMTYFPIPKGESEKNVKVSQLLEKLTGSVTRLPILDADKKPKYMIHESRLNKYIAGDDKKKDNTLETFLADEKAKGNEYGLNRGFIVVSESTTLAEAKRRMEMIASCQDIFITKEGREDAVLCGWIPNTRITQLLEV